MTDFDHFANSYETDLNRSVAFSGDSSEYFADYKAAYFARLFRRHGAGRVLDYGCGIGLLAERLHRELQPVEVDGFDVSDESLERVSAGLKASGTYTSQVANLRPPYSYIVVSNVLHHIPPPQRPATFQTFRDLLAPGGRLVVFEHNPMNPATRWVVAHCPFDEDAILLHPREVRQLTQQVKMSADAVSFIVFFPKFLAFLRPLEARLGWLPAGAQYCFVGRREI